MSYSHPFLKPMRTILDEIVEHKIEEIKSLPSVDPAVVDRTSLIDAVLRINPGFITEIKPKSPSVPEGLIAREKIPEMVQIYRRNAEAISVLCDEKYFGGGFDLLNEVHQEAPETPLLAKEFIISEVQIDHAAHNGASAILLIVAILTPQRLAELAKHATDLGLEILVETHDLEEANVAATILKAHPELQFETIVGVNNRNLKIMQTDVKTTEEVAPYLHKRLPTQGIISESGIKTPEDIRRLSRHVQGFLIGESILKAKNPEEYLQSLRTAL